MALGKKTGGRKKGSKDKKLRATKLSKAIGIQAFETLAQLDRKKGEKSMAEIMVERARFVARLAEQAERDLAEKKVGEEYSVQLAQTAAKLARDASPYLYPTLQSIKHGGDEDAPPIRIENLSDHQLEKLIERLRRG